MSYIYKLISHRLRRMHKFAKNVLFFTIALMFMLYIYAAAANIFAPYSTDYLRAKSLYRALMEAAPATFAAGVCAAIISDIALNKKDGDDEE